MRSPLLLVTLFASTAIAQPLPEASISWTPPIQTVGGNPFQPHRYEINYRYVGQTEWARYIIVNPAITSVIIQSPEFEDVDWRVRAYDENCVPGPWTDVQTIIMQQTDSPPQLQATGIQVENKLPDPVEGCGENCTVIEE